MKQITSLLLFLGAGVLAAEPTEILIDEPDEALQPVRCVRVASIDRTEILDERNIVFYMRGQDIYRNVLPRRCPGLRPRDAFMYRTAMNRLCDIDLITILNPIGAGFMPGPSCGLGKFYPVTEPEVKGLKEQIERAKKVGLDDIE